ncbi:Alpha/Beta hydrolase protein [Suillus subalutaceus]|uniref:Alpha/Beta hydrolase protein n=1 Tax=Suillus subalutaceus TaxID=48586 RepID=UPI001B8750DD|nr:Alpha/Beta hydrolase protein [Suillus subalutaceus]KAG1876598.1 Alpha/Beta hydrolase protein [Suillus subalutaceus]
MSSLKVREAEADFNVPGAGKPCKTWYKVYGTLPHPHNPPLVLTRLFDVPVIVYDQLGNGRSTHLPEKNGDVDFWTVQLFVDELHNLLNHLNIHDNYNVLGQSWGGMLASEFATRQPKGLGKLVIAGSPASTLLWVKAANELRKELPKKVQDVLNKHEAADTTTDPEYIAATNEFHKRHFCRLDPMPQSLLDGFAWIEKDPSVCLTMTWSMVDRLHNIQATTLLINGRYDEAQDIVVEPFFQRIPKVRWVQFADSAHVPQLEETERFMQVVWAFLRG